MSSTGEEMIAAYTRTDRSCAVASDLTVGLPTDEPALNGRSI
jgi:hypothetical protein